MICYPSDTDWGCAFPPEKLAEMRSEPETLRQMELAEARAWYSLAALTSYQLGVCPEEIRPVASRCAPAGSWMSAVVGGGHTSALPLRTIGGTFTPYVTGGTWVNACGCGPTGCSCSDRRDLILPGPVGAIEKIQIGTDVIDSGRYRVDNGNILVSTDPDLLWPLAQDIYAAPGTEGTFVVTYYRGMAPNELTRSAAGALAAEYFKLCRGSGKDCRFPRKLKTVTRGSATYEIDTTLFENGLTGLPEADALINILNPYRVKSRPRVISPDAGRRPRHTSYRSF